MKIKMMVAISGNRDGQRWPPIGGVTEVPDQEGAELCAAGMAKPVAEKPQEKVEKAVPPKDEEQREATTGSAELTTETAESTVPKRGPGRPRKNPA